MPKTVVRLHLGEEHDKEALEQLEKTIEFEELAVKAATPAERERYGEQARLARDRAIEALREAKIAWGPEMSELENPGNTQF